jgi:hypothetical protein
LFDPPLQLPVLVKNFLVLNVAFELPVLVRDPAILNAVFGVSIFVVDQLFR